MVRKSQIVEAVEIETVETAPVPAPVEAVAPAADTAPAPTGKIIIEFPADWSVTAEGFTLTAAHLTNPATLAYVAGNGFRQSIGDAQNRAGKIKEAAVEAWLVANGHAKDAKGDTRKLALAATANDPAITEKIAAARGDRFNAIVNGEMVLDGRQTAKSATLADLIETTVVQIVDASLAASAVRKGIKLPTNKAAMQVLRDAHLAKHGKAVRLQAHAMLGLDEEGNPLDSDD